jgi:glutaminyl-peptide cyclotransferase
VGLQIRSWSPVAIEPLRNAVAAAAAPGEMALNRPHVAPTGVPRHRQNLPGVVFFVTSIAIMSFVYSVAPRAQRKAPTPVYGYDVINVYPHDREAFTQGLLYRDGVLFESTGLKGRSTLRKVELQTGKVLQQARVDSRYFAEGLTEWGNRLVQLTWDTNVGFVYDVASLTQTRTFSYTGEGWGLTHDGRRLIMSDGTPTLRFLDPETFRVTGTVTVKDGDVPIEDLNELEHIDGEIYANVWTTDRIAIISPATGAVTGWINLAGLMPRQATVGDAVLNGIAYDARGRRLFVTGKLWPRLFEIRVRK